MFTFFYLPIPLHSIAYTLAAPALAANILIIIQVLKTCLYYKNTISFLIYTITYLNTPVPHPNDIMRISKIK